MRDIIIDLQKSDTWKIQLTIAINFISSIDSKKKRMMHSKGDNIKCMPYNDVNEVVNELFDSLCSRYQINLETLMRGSNLVFDSVIFLHYKCHKVNFRCGGSYIDSTDWINSKKVTINPKTTDDKCFQYAVTVALSYEKNESHPESVSSIKVFINKFN